MSGKTEIRPSLKTSDYSEAKRRKSAVVDHWTSILDDLRRRRELTEDDISAAVWEHYNVGLEAGSKARSKRPTPADIEEAFDKATAEAFQSGAHEAAR